MTGGRIIAGDLRVKIVDAWGREYVVLPACRAVTPETLDGTAMARAMRAAGVGLFVDPDGGPIGVIFYQLKRSPGEA